MRSDWGSLQKRKRKSGQVWVARYVDPARGKKTTRTLGRVRDFTEAQARAMLRALRRRVEAKPVGARPTLAEFLDSYADVHRSRAPASHEATYLQLRHVAEWLGATPMAEVGVDRAEQLVAHLVTRGWRRRLSSNTARAYVVRLRAVWEAARRRGIVAANPWKSVRPPREEEKPVSAVTDAELDLLVAACPPRLRAFVRVLGETGLRRGEALRLRWEDVAGGLLTVRESKIGRPRVVPLSPRAEAAFAAIPRERGIGRANLVFPGLIPDASAACAALRELRRACRKAGLDVLTFHGLRHSLGYRMARQGCTELEIAEVLGHRQLSTTRRYMAHHPGSAAARAMKKLAAGEDHLRTSSSAASGSKDLGSQTR